VSIKDEMAADAAEIIAEIGEPVNWKGRTYSALVSDPAIGEDLGLGGFSGTGDFTIKIMRSALGDARPKLGEIIGFETAQYRITRITDHPRYPMVVLVVSPED
jgi:hypothetical protein